VSGPSNVRSLAREAESLPPVRARLGAAWLLVPLSALSLILLVPVALGIRGFVRNRRAMRDYRRDTLRPLPRD
jgi:hypothetical protein